jgi:hypothetical protein
MGFGDGMLLVSEGEPGIIETGISKLSLAITTTYQR